MRGAAVILFLILAASAGAAETAEALFSQFDLYGNWAVRCDQPASPMNPHVTIAAISAGVLTEEQNTGPDFQLNTYLIATAEKVDPTSLRVHVLFRAGTGDQVGQTIIWRVANKTRRTLFNQLDGGKVLVRDGVVVTTGSHTPLLHKCG
jgi:hypothetical protein